ncbi:MAG: glycosyltransferase family 4 protein [Planctomycetota bacterium]
MTDLRVGIVTENHYPSLGGMEFSNHLLSRALQRQPSTRVSVASTGPAFLPPGFSYPYRHYRSRSLSVLTAYFRRRNVERMVVKERINVLHGPMLHGGGLRAVRAAERHRLPVVVSAQGADVQTVPEIGYGARLDPVAEERMRGVVSRADRIVALSRMNRDLLVELGADPAKVVLVPNGVAHAEIGAVPHEDRRATLGLSPDRFVLLTVGRASPVKRIDLLFRALAIARARAPRLRCVSVGPKEKLAAAAQRAGVEDLVLLPGPVVAGGEPPAPELVHLYRAADLYVSVSHVESFGNAALEALACGTPVLVTRRHGVRDVLTDESGFVAEEETPEALARLLIDLSQRDLGQRRAAVRASVAHLTWDNAAARLREVFLSLL